MNDFIDHVVVHQELGQLFGVVYVVNVENVFGNHILVEDVELLEGVNQVVRWYAQFDSFLYQSAEMFVEYALVHLLEANVEKQLLVATGNKKVHQEGGVKFWLLQILQGEFLDEGVQLLLAILVIAVDIIEHVEFVVEDLAAVPNALRPRSVFHLFQVLPPVLELDLQQLHSLQDEDVVVSDVNILSRLLLLDLDALARLVPLVDGIEQLLADLDLVEDFEGGLVLATGKLGYSALLVVVELDVVESEWEPVLELGGVEEHEGVILIGDEDVLGDELHHPVVEGVVVVEVEMAALDDGGVGHEFEGVELVEAPVGDEDMVVLVGLLELASAPAEVAFPAGILLPGEDHPVDLRIWSCKAQHELNLLLFGLQIPAVADAQDQQLLAVQESEQDEVEFGGQLHGQYLGRGGCALSGFHFFGVEHGLLHLGVAHDTGHVAIELAVVAQQEGVAHDGVGVVQDHQLGVALSVDELELLRGAGDGHEGQRPERVGHGQLVQQVEAGQRVEAQVTAGVAHRQPLLLHRDVHLHHRATLRGLPHCLVALLVVVLDQEHEHHRRLCTHDGQGVRELDRRGWPADVLLEVEVVREVHVAHDRYVLLHYYNYA